MESLLIIVYVLAYYLYFERNSQVLENRECLVCSFMAKPLKDKGERVLSLFEGTLLVQEIS